MRAADRLHQRVDAEAQAEVEHDRAVFDQQIVVARAAIGDASAGLRRRSRDRDDAVVGAMP